MTINEYEAFLKWHFENWKLNCAHSDSVEEARKIYDRIYQSNKPNHIAERERGFMAWKAGRAQAVPVWISTDFMLPDEDEAVLFMDKNNVIHDGYLSTDYVDGPYGENGEDFGDNQTLWASNSNGDEFLLNKVKYWMHRPSNPITGGSGAEP